MCRRAVTLMEMIIAIAVIVVLFSMTVPAMQKARESANRATCANNLRQLSLAIQNYQNDYKRIPAGYQESSHGMTLNTRRGNTWYAYILPYIEQDTIARLWNHEDPFGNVLDLSSGPPYAPLPPGVALSSFVINTFMCPSDALTPNSFGLNNSLGIASSGPCNYAPSSYVGNAGSISYFPGVAHEEDFPNPLYVHDGVMNIISSEFPNSHFLDFVEIPDGQSHTAMLSERFHFDPHFDQFPLATIDYPISHWSAWGWSGGWQAAGHVLGSSQVPINYRVDPTAPSGHAAEKDGRLGGFSSAHSSGCHFAMCDGTVQYISNRIAPATLKLLCCRYDGPPVGEY